MYGINEVTKTNDMENLETTLQEFKKLKAKCNPSKGHMQGLTLVEYYKIISLHKTLLSTEKGKKEYQLIK